MPFNKPHMEFVELDMAQGWETPPGYPSGIKQKILAAHRAGLTEVVIPERNRRLAKSVRHTHSSSAVNGTAPVRPAGSGGGFVSQNAPR